MYRANPSPDHSSDTLVSARVSPGTEHAWWPAVLPAVEPGMPARAAGTVDSRVPVHPFLLVSEPQRRDLPIEIATAPESEVQAGPHAALKDMAGRDCVAQPQAGFFQGRCFDTDARGVRHDAGASFTSWKA